MLSLFSSQLEALSNLPVKLLKLSLESILVKKIACYLGKFLSIFYLHLSADILLVLAFILIATLAYYIITLVLNLLFGGKKCKSSTKSSSSCSSSRSSSGSCSLSSLCSSSSSSYCPSKSSESSSCSSVTICTSCTF